MSFANFLKPLRTDIKVCFHMYGSASSQLLHTARSALVMTWNGMEWSAILNLNKICGLFLKPSCSPDLVPSDFYIFTPERALRGRHFFSDEEAKTAVDEWGIHSLIRPWRKSVERNGDGIEDWKICSAYCVIKELLFNFCCFHLSDSRTFTKPALIRWRCKLYSACCLLKLLYFEESGALLLSSRCPSARTLLWSICDEMRTTIISHSYPSDEVAQARPDPCVCATWLYPVPSSCGCIGISKRI